jgi:hypothetical protein
MVGKQGFEPWTSTASGWRSPPELLAYKSLSFFKLFEFWSISSKTP